MQSLFSVNEIFTPPSGITRAVYVKNFLSDDKQEGGTIFEHRISKYYLEENLSDLAPSLDGSDYGTRLRRIADILRQAVDYDTSLICLPSIKGCRYDDRSRPFNYFMVESVRGDFDEEYIRSKQQGIIENWLRFGNIFGKR